MFSGRRGGDKLRYPETLAFIIDPLPNVTPSQYILFNNELDAISQVCVENGVRRAWVVTQASAQDSEEGRASFKELVTKATSARASSTSATYNIHILPELFDINKVSQFSDGGEAPPVEGTSFDWVFVLDYSAKTDIVRAIQGMAAQNLNPEKLEDMLPNALIFGGNAPPDLIVYLAGKRRLGEACIWAGAYSEFVFEDKDLSQFGVEDFRSAIEEYAKRDRRFGALGEETTVDTKRRKLDT